MTLLEHLMYVFPQFNSPRALHPLLFMLPWTPNACSYSKCQIRITTLMTHDFKMLWMCVFPQFNTPQSHRPKTYYFLMFLWTLNESFSQSVMYNIPVFCVVQNSCFLWCTIFLYDMLYLSLFCLNLSYKSLDVYNSGVGVVPNSDVYKYSDPKKIQRL